jgi:hypothetical protein
VKFTLITIGCSCVAFVIGFLVAAWVRQPDLEKERVELALCRERVERMQQLLDDLKADLRDTAQDVARRIA